MKIWISIPWGSMDPVTSRRVRAPSLPPDRYPGIIVSMLVQCWANVGDSGTTLNQRRWKAVCSLCEMTHGKHMIQIYYFLNVGPASQTVAHHQINLGSTLAVSCGRMPHQYRSLLQCPFPHRGCPKPVSQLPPNLIRTPPNGEIWRRIVYFQGYQDITRHALHHVFFISVISFESDT